jgi:hypothetical protein
MNRTKAEDLYRASNEVADLAVLLRTYHLDFLAKKLDFVREFLDSMNQANGQLRRKSGAPRRLGATIVVLENFRKNSGTQRPAGPLARGCR